MLARHTMLSITEKIPSTLPKLHFLVKIDRVQSRNIVQLFFKSKAGFFNDQFK
jgi:hypothetical protein